MRDISAYPVNLGCDPEFFFTKKGKVIGSEQIIPPEGLKLEYGGSIIIDGVQAELNPSPSSCREIVAVNIQNLLMLAKRSMDGEKGVSIDFTRTVKVPKKEMKALSDDSKKFGCANSRNVHNRGGMSKKITVDPEEYRSRSAGGHIHLGFFGDKSPANIQVKRALSNPKRLVPILDILVGNTAVLLDRDRGNITRRKLYGKAGEYRTPAHGLEYRTLSNFWLQSYPLMSLMFGLARLSVDVIADSKPYRSYYRAFMNAVEMQHIQKAINENDFDLAWANFLKIEPILRDIIPTKSNYFPLHSENIKQFKHFVKKGMGYWFKDDPLAHWEKLVVRSSGIGSFLTNTVQNDIDKK